MNKATQVVSWGIVLNLCVWIGATGAWAGEQATEEEPHFIRNPDVIYVPTPHDVVQKMLEMAEVKKGDVVYDLGCGDGRIVVAAAKKYGVKAVGFDIDPQRIKEARENVKKNKVEHLVRIEQKDIFTLDLSEATVITLYLLPQLNVKLIPQLEKLKPGSRIVSHDFDMAGVIPDKVVQFKSKNGQEHTLYLWTTPLKKEKTE
ncbi:MAG: SAM-dependent methyltransferase [Thermogutta sp.]